MNAYIVSHNGMGDNLYMIGAINYIKQFYENVFFICKNKYYENVKLFNASMICIPFDEKNEFEEIYKLLIDKYQNKLNDIFICGCHTQYLNSKVTNPKFLNHRMIMTVRNEYNIDYDTLTSNNYAFIENFYKDIGLNLTHFYDYYDLPSTDESKELLNAVSNYYIVFIQYKSSDGKTLNISNLLKKYLNDKNVILLCNDMNLYQPHDDKYKLAQLFVFNKIANYVDIIKNSNEIYIIDSCFVGIVLPLLKKNQLKSTHTRIILRDHAHEYIL